MENVSFSKVSFLKYPTGEDETGHAGRQTCPSPMENRKKEVFGKEKEIRQNVTTHLEIIEIVKAEQHIFFSFFSFFLFFSLFFSFFLSARMNSCSCTLLLM